MRWLVLEPQLPWDTSSSDERKFKAIVFILFILSLTLSILISRVILPPKERKRAEIPERMVKMVLEQKKKVIPPPPPPPPKEEKKPEKKEPKKKKPEKKKIIKKKPPEKKPDRQKAREVAEKQMAVFDALADLRDEAPINKIEQKKQLTLGETKARTVERDMITNSAKQGSGGVRIGKASSGIAGTGLSGGGSQTVSSGLALTRQKQKRRATVAGKSQRPSENIEQYMDRNKSKFFALYNRELRRNPGMEGEVIFKITILPSGKVSHVKIVSSDLNNPKLEKRLMTLIRLINFGAMKVETWSDNYRMTFLPS